MKKIFNFLLITVVIFGLNSCKKQINLNANIRGQMLLFDRMDEDFYWIFNDENNEFLNMNDHSGINVKFYKDKKHCYETQTDKDGYFYLQNIPTGTYKVTFTKDGYSPFVFRDYMVVGGETELFTVPDPNYTMMRKIHTNLQHKNNLFLRNDTIFFDIPEEDEFNVYHLFLLSTENNISDTTFMDYYCMWYDNEYTLDWERKFLIFNAGDTIYWRNYNFNMDIIYHDEANIFDGYFVDWYYNGRYCKLYGISNENYTDGYIVVPDNFVSKLPDGVISPEPKTFDIKPMSR